jgi:hypothetical protein
MRSDHLCQAKVNDFRDGRFALVAHHDVLKFEVSVHYAVAVHIFQAASDLVSYLLDTFLAYLKVSRLDVVEKVCACHVLEYDIVVGGVLK